MESVDGMPVERLLRQRGCFLGVTHDVDNLRGMLAIKVGFLMATINALISLQGG